MSEKPSAKTDLNILDDKAVKAYLEQHPGFFLQNSDILEHLDFPPNPAAQGNVRDFQSHALHILRKRVELQGLAQDELMDVARANMTIQARMHDAALAALDAENLTHLVHVVTADWVDILDVDVISLCLEEKKIKGLGPQDGVVMLAKGMIDALLGSSHAVVLHGGVKGDARIFGAAADLVQAEALVGLRIPGREALGLLAFGARDARAFSPGQGTELLRFLGHILERALSQWMKTV